MTTILRRVGSLFTGYCSLLTLFALPVVAPLLHWWQVACTHDDHLHRFRIAALRYAWENGLFFSRWVPDLAFGYGYPFFIYREPLPLYLILIPHYLGLPLTAATNLFYLLCIVLGAGFMFLWVRDVLGPAAALVSALAYLTTPYILIDAYIRGNIVESLALALLPLLCWAGQRYVVAGGWRLAAGEKLTANSRQPTANTHHASRTTFYFLLTTLTLAALALSHNISLLIFTPMFLVYLLVVGWLHRVDGRGLILRVGLVLALGLGVTAFYTGSAVLEIGQVSLNQSVNNRNNDFHYNFTSLDELLAPVSAKDPSLLNAPLPFRLGWVPAGLALVGLGLVFRQKERVRRGHIVLMGLFAAALLFMSSPLSVTIWESLPLINFIQFPWRFVGRAALPIAFLAGVPFADLRLTIGDLRRAVSREPLAGGISPAANRQRPAAILTHYAPRLMFYAILLALVLETLPNLYPNTCTELPYPTINDLHRYEHETGLVGVDPTGSYFPVTVQERPTGSRLEADYQAGQTPQRWELPPDVGVEAVEYGHNRGRVQLTTSAPFTARYLTFAFPGWHAEIDGQPVPITPSDPEGLITFPVPAGSHTLTVYWGWTTRRAVLAGLSLLAGLGIVGVAVSRWPLAVSRWPLAAGISPAATRLSPAAFFIALTLIALKFLVVDNLETPFRHAAAPAVQHPFTLTVSGLQLAGYDLSDETVPSGGMVTVDLAWQTLAPPGRNLQTSLALLGDDGLSWSVKELWRPRLYEDAPDTLFWQAGQWGWDSWEVTTLPGTPAGMYDLVLTVFDLNTLQPLTLAAADGSSLGPTVVLGQIEVTTPRRPVTVAPQYPAQLTLNDWQLLGYNLDRETARPGDHFLLTLFWEAQAEGPATLPLYLLDAGGAVVQTWEIPPVRDGYAAATGERVRGQHWLRVAAALPSGTYQLQLDQTPLHPLILTAPDRILTSLQRSRGDYTIAPRSPNNTFAPHT